jgi:hypothetical protein
MTVDLKSVANTPMRRLPQLSRRAYWTLALTAVALYLGLWLVNLPYVYGWQADDWACYMKGLDTVSDAKAAFQVRANLLQPYFFLYSYLPICSGISLPSHELPIYGANTGNYRFFLLWTILYHGVIAVSWAWFALKICRSRAAGLLSLVVLLTSQEFVLWTPQPDTRLIGLPLVLAGIWLVARSAGRDPAPGRRRAGELFLAGSLFAIAQSLHYTSLYLLVPMSIVFCAADAWSRCRRLAFWGQWGVFALGCIWLPGLLELVSHFAVGYPWSAGPFAAMLKLNAQNESPFGMARNLGYWGEFSLGLLGAPLLVAAAVGALLFMRRWEGDLPGDAARRRASAAAVFLGLVVLIVLPSMPYFRKTALLQPFLFLFAAVAILAAASTWSRRRLVRVGLLAALLACVLPVPLRRSGEVFRGHLGLGRLLSWAENHRGDRQLRWLVLRRPFLYMPDDIARDDPENWVLAYFPLERIRINPSLSYELEAAEPLRSEPTLWGTYCTYTFFAGAADLRQEPAVTEARIYRAGDLAAVRATDRKLRVGRVVADSQLDPAAEPANVFDRDASPDGETGWASADASGPHGLEIDFENPERLGEISIVQGLLCAQRIAHLEILAGPKAGPLRTVWKRSGIAPRQVLTARWDALEVGRLVLLMRQRTPFFGVPSGVRVQELIFPDREVEGPPPQRIFPPLVLRQIVREGADLVARGKNISPSTVLVVDGRPLKTDRRQIPARLPLSIISWRYPVEVVRAVLPPAEQARLAGAEVHLSDAFRRSNSIRLDLGLPPSSVSDSHGSPGRAVRSAATR